MKISASIYSKNNLNILETINELKNNNINTIHIDCNDNINTFKDIEFISNNCECKIDLHLISSTPEIYYSKIEKYKCIDQITFQYENLNSNFVLPNLNIKMGIGIINSTEISIFDKYSNVANYILFMSTIPGQSGGKFNDYTFEKIKQFKKLYPNKEIQIDGGINDIYYKQLYNKIDLMVIGSFLFKNSISNSIKKLKK